LPNPPPIRFLGSSFLGKIPLSELDPETIIPLARPGAEIISGFPLVIYFQTIQQVIEKKGYENLLAALQTRLGRRVTVEEIKEILIYSEKHGSDYHPARVEVCLAEQVIPFVMNVALTDRGRLVLSNEFRVLGELNREYDLPYLPKAYFMDESESGSGPEGNPPVRMVLAEWLEGFHEFHLSRDPIGDKQKLVLWDSAFSDHCLPDWAADKIYSEMAYILTCYYDLQTFAQIHPWHLAAGDFIARIEGDRVEVRLVAARQYGPLIGPPDLRVEEALLFFLLNLTLRIRLDRLDGVGDLAWADKGCLRPAVAGFDQALKDRQQTGVLPENFLEGYQKFLSRQAEDDLEDRLSALVDIVEPSGPDFPVMTRHLNRHLKELFPLIRN
jgi:hypothetical protein